MITDILDDLGYKDYEVNKNCIKFRTSCVATATDRKRFCVLRVKGSQVHIHGSEIDCTFINLASPGSIDRLRCVIVNSEEPNGRPGKS